MPPSERKTKWIQSNENASIVHRFFFFNIIIFYFDKIILQNYLQIMNSASMFMCRLLVFLGLMMQLNE